MTTQKTASTLRKLHRILGFFLAGIMAVYAFSGVLLIFRKTDLLQYDQTTEHQLKPGLQAQSLGDKLRIRGFEVIEDTAEQVIFEEGSYNKKSGLATVTEEDYAPVVQKLVKLHKATTSSPLYFLNIFFGCALLFFAVSSFFMFLPKLPVYRTGLKIAAAGFVFALVVVFMG